MKSVEIKRMTVISPDVQLVFVPQEYRGQFDRITLECVDLKRFLYRKEGTLNFKELDLTDIPECIEEIKKKLSDLQISVQKEKLVDLESSLYNHLSLVYVESCYREDFKSVVYLCIKKVHNINDKNDKTQLPQKTS